MTVPQTCEECQKVDKSCIKQVKELFKNFIKQLFYSTNKRVRNLASKMANASRAHQNQAVRNRPLVINAEISTSQATKNARSNSIKPVKNCANKKESKKLMNFIYSIIL